MEGGAKIFEVFRVKNHDFTPKNYIFSNCGGRRENCWGISCEKSRFYAKKSYFFPILGGAHRPGCAPPPHPWIRPWFHYDFRIKNDVRFILPPAVCRMVHVLVTLSENGCVQHILCCVMFLFCFSSSCVT